MAVSPPQAYKLAGAVADAYAQAEFALMQTVAGYVAKGKDTPAYLENQLKETTALRKAAEKIMNTTAKHVQGTAAVAIEKAAGLGQAEAAREIARFTKSVSPDLQGGFKTNNQAVALLALETNAKLQSMHQPILRSVDDSYRRITAQIAQRRLAGGVTLQQATQQALDAFAAKGITGFTDKAGRKWEMSAYAEMTLRTATSRALIQSHTAELVSRGYTLVIVNDEPQECHICRPYEGKVLSIDSAAGTGLQKYKGKLVKVYDSLANAEAAGLYHPNCRHSHSAFLPGVTDVPSPSETQDPQGEKDRDRLRYLERGARAAKRKAAVAQGPEAIKAANARVAQWSKAIKHHTDTTSAKRQRYRENPRIGNAGNAIGGGDGVKLPTPQTPTPPTPAAPAAPPPAPVVPGAKETAAKLAKFAQANLDEAGFKAIKAIQFGKLPKEAKPGAMASKLADLGKPYDPKLTPTKPPVQPKPPVKPKPTQQDIDDGVADTYFQLPSTIDLDTIKNTIKTHADLSAKFAAAGDDLKAAISAAVSKKHEDWFKTKWTGPKKIPGTPAPPTSGAPAPKPPAAKPKAKLTTLEKQNIAEAEALEEWLAKLPPNATAEQWDELIENAKTETNNAYNNGVAKFKHGGMVNAAIKLKFKKSQANPPSATEAQLDLAAQNAPKGNIAPKAGPPAGLTDAQFAVVQKGIQVQASKFAKMDANGVSGELSFYENKLAATIKSDPTDINNITYQQGVVDAAKAIKAVFEEAAKLTKVPKSVTTKEARIAWVEQSKKNAEKKLAEVIAAGDAGQVKLYQQVLAKLADLDADFKSNTQKASTSRTIKGASTFAGQAGRKWASQIWDSDGERAYGKGGLEALESYTGSGYVGQNAKLRGDLYESLTNKYTGNVGKIKAAMKKAPTVPEDIVVARNSDAIFFGLKDHELAGKIDGLVGQTFHDYGFMSTSVNAEGAMGSKAIKAFIRVPKGQRAIYVSGDPDNPSKIISSVGGGEAELLLDAGTHYRLLEVRKIGKNRYEVDVEIVPPPVVPPLTAAEKAKAASQGISEAQALEDKATALANTPEKIAAP